MDVRDEVDSHGDIGDAQGAPDAQHDGHGHDGAAHTPEDACAAVGEGEQAVEQGHRAGVVHAEGYHGGVAVEQGDQEGGQGEDGHSDELRQHGAADEAELHALAHPVEAPGADVLADEGGQGQGEAGDREEGEALNLAVGAAAGHGRGAEGVDIGLDDHVGQGDHRALHTGGDAQRDHLAEHGSLKADAPPVHPVACPGAGEPAEGQEGAEDLAEDGGQGGGAHPPVEHRHEEEIQHHIGQGGQDQVDHGAAAVPHGLEDAGPHVIEHHRDGAQEIDPEIEDGVVNYVGRRPHPVENQRRERHAQHSEHRAGRQAQGQGGVDSPLQVLLVLGAVKAGDEHTGAQGHAVDEADEQQDQAGGGADRSQGLLADELAHNQRVHCVVELLEQVAEKNRQREQEHLPGDAAGGQPVLAVVVHGSNICLPEGDQGTGPASDGARAGGSHNGSASRPRENVTGGPDSAGRFRWPGRSAPPHRR